MSTIVHYLDQIIAERNRLAAAISNTNAQPAKNKAQTIGELALRQRDTAKGAADYINAGSYPQAGYRATHHKQNPVIGPTDWCGRARDEEYLVVHGGQDTVARAK